MFNNIYKNKKILITGHTGFKGSWLSSWLISLGANVVGVSNGIPTEPSNFVVSNLISKVNDIRLDVCDSSCLTEIICNEKPDFIFHMAAQALVRESYANPLETIRTNVLGTVSLLDAIRNSQCKHRMSVVLITSDKVYANKEWLWGYRENDELGGIDPYSASKSAAEISISSYLNSFFKNKSNDILFSIVRAGNVIGGGDWAKDRIVPDAARAANRNESVVLRSPNATRPWQHVLEPLSGYLTLAERNYSDGAFNYESFNFGPNSNDNHTVADLINELNKTWCKVSSVIENDVTNQKEANLLKLVCDKADSLLFWRPALRFEETSFFTAEWYRKYYESKRNDMEFFTMNQIDEYADVARKRGIHWAK